MVNLILFMLGFIGVSYLGTQAWVMYMFYLTDKEERENEDSSPGEF